MNIVTIKTEDFAKARSYTSPVDCPLFCALTREGKNPSVVSGTYLALLDDKGYERIYNFDHKFWGGDEGFSGHVINDMIEGAQSGKEYPDIQLKYKYQWE